MTPSEAVAAGYNATADLYLDFICNNRLDEQKYYINIFLNSLPERAAVLDLGCGCGIPHTKALAQKFDVTGIDISERQIQMARENVPGCQFINADILAHSFAEASFDGILAFYSLFHIPRADHLTVLKRIYTWLRPAGFFVGCFLANENEFKQLMDNSMRNAPMFLSGYNPIEVERLFVIAGFSIISAKTETAIEKDGNKDSFFWVVAQKAA